MVGCSPLRQGWPQWRRVPILGVDAHYVIPPEYAFSRATLVGCPQKLCENVISLGMIHPCVNTAPGHESSSISSNWRFFCAHFTRQCLRTLTHSRPTNRELRRAPHLRPYALRTDGVATSSPWRTSRSGYVRNLVHTARSYDQSRMGVQVDSGPIARKSRPASKLIDQKARCCHQRTDRSRLCGTPTSKT